MKAIYTDLPELKESENVNAPEVGEFYVTDPTHGGKVTCHKCNGFILKKDHLFILKRDWHEDCFNRYEHYYGLDRPID